MLGKTGARPLGELPRVPERSRCSFWVLKRTFAELCLMSAFPRKQTSADRIGMSALCQKRT
jgi:hypothetical protein